MRKGTSQRVRYELESGSLTGLTIKPGCGSCTSIDKRGDNFVEAVFTPTDTGHQTKKIFIKDGTTPLGELTFNVTVNA